MNDPVSIVRRALLGAGLLAALPATAAEDPARFPSKPVRVIVGFAAGGTTDVLARYIGQKLSERWGQPVVIENRAGGGSTIGAAFIARAEPDGYNLLMANITHAINLHLMPNLPYDTLRDFTSLASLGTSPFLLLLNPKVPAKTLPEFIALLKAHPGKYNFGTLGQGGITHLAAKLIDMTAGTEMMLVPYKGAGPAMAGILAGDVDVYLDAPATTMQYIQSGQLRPIGVTGTTRIASLPDVPPMSEAGVPGFDVTIWYGFMGPRNLPPAITARINADVAAVLSTREAKDKLDGMGVMPWISSPQAFGSFINAEQDKYGRIVKQAQIKLE